MLLRSASLRAHSQEKKSDATPKPEAAPKAAAVKVPVPKGGKPADAGKPNAPGAHPAAHPAEHTDSQGGHTGTAKPSDGQ